MIFRQIFIPLYIQPVSRGHILSSYDIPPGIRRLSRSWCILWEASSCSSRRELQKRYAFPDCRHGLRDRLYSCGLFHGSHEENEDFMNNYSSSSGNNNTGVYKVKKQSEKKKGPSKSEIIKETFGL